MYPRLRANTVVLTFLFAGLPAGQLAFAVEARPPVDSGAAAASALTINPPRVTLAPGKTHRLLVTVIPSDGFETDATANARFASDRPEVVAVDARGVLRAIGAGTATVTATVDGKSTTAEVSVLSSASAPDISFVNDVMPVISRVGCNAGSCHAKPEGQNGFKLSVFAYDLKSDYKAIVKGDRGRRIFPAARRRACCCSSRRSKSSMAAVSGFRSILSLTG